MASGMPNHPQQKRSEAALRIEGDTTMISTTLNALASSPFGAFFSRGLLEIEAFFDEALAAAVYIVELDLEEYGHVWRKGVEC
jgi:hypothetical protein